MGFFENRYSRIVLDFEPVMADKPALRVNTLKIDACALGKRLGRKKVKLERIPYLADGYWYESPFSLGATPEYLQGYYYLQGSASQLVSEVLDPRPGETILDMAAAPGSKTTHLAQLMRNQGSIVAVDENAQRLAALRNNCERLLIRNVLMIKKDARFVRDLGLLFDRVLLDAPCSGNYCSEPGWFEKRRIDDVKANARVQRELFKAAYDVLAPGGTLVYSTCSLEPEEDELVIDWALGKFSDLDAQEIPQKVGDPGIVEWEGRRLDPRLSRTRRFWPHRTQTEGFFVAKLRKTPGKQ
jgi:tRNA (cytosine40_48-C5)-methyltransferase